MANSIDALIANFPGTLQENQLRASQNALALQKMQQNALQLQQQQQGQNALASIYANQSNIDPSTGLPTGATLGPLIQANPDLGLTMAETIAKLGDERSRAALTNLKVADEYGNIFNSEVATPLIRFDQQLQEQGIAGPERQQMVEQKRRELLDQTSRQYAWPDRVRNGFNIPYDSTWAFRSDALQKRQDMIAKAWQANYDYKDPNNVVEYKTNPFYPGVTMNANLSAPYTPSGIAKPPGKVEGYFTDTFKNEKGETETRTFTRDTRGNAIDPNTGKPYTIRGNAAPVKAATGRQPTPIMVRGPGYGPTLATPPSGPGDIWKDQSGNEIAPPTSKVNINDPDYPGSGQMSPAALAYMGERERLGLHMSASWGTSKYLPQMAEMEARSSLGLPSGAPLTIQDAQAAALNDVAIQRGMHADSQALTTIARTNANIQLFEGTAERASNLVEQLGPKGVAGGDLLWNRFRQAGRREISIDPDMNQLDVALTTFKNEYVKIMTTATGGGGQMTSDAARREGDKLFNVNQPWPVMKGNLDVARQDMRNKVDSARADYNAQIAAIRNKGIFAEERPVVPTEGRLPETAPPPAAASAPAPKANSGTILGQKYFRSADDFENKIKTQDQFKPGQAYQYDDKTAFYKYPDGRVVKLTPGPDGKWIRAQ